MLLSALFGTVSAFFMPAYQALIPEVLPSESLQAGNALAGISISTSMIAGPAIGAGLFAWGRAAAAFGFDALTFLLSAIATIFLRVAPRALRLESSILADVREGWGYMRRTTWLWVTVFLASFANAISGATAVVLLPVVSRHLHLGVGYMGLTLTISGVVAVVGNLVLAHVGKIPRRAVTMYLLWSLLNVSTILLGLAGSYAWVAVVGVLLGMGFAGETIWQSLVQEYVPDEFRSRVFSLDLLGSFALRPVGFAAAGILASIIGATPTLIAGGSIGLAFTLSGLLVPSVRTIE